VTGITGQVGGALARALLAAGHQVRAVVREPAKGEDWARLGCTVSLADMRDPRRLAAAFSDAAGVFVLPPPELDPAPGFPEARAIVTTVHTALGIARPTRVVCLSTIGAQATQINLLTERTLLEQSLGTLKMPITFLRPAWFLENYAWDVATARDEGVLRSFLEPLDEPVPMVATEDVGRVGATLLLDDWTGTRVVELEGPRRVTPNDVAAALGRLLHRPVRAEAIPRDAWEGIFRAQGMRNPLPRMRMLDGFNEGWIEFEAGEAGSLKGEVEPEAVLAELVRRAA